MSDQKDNAQKALQAKPDILGFYLHYKGNAYFVYSVSVNEANGEHLVHYYSIERKTRWTRTWDNFFMKVEARNASNTMNVMIDRFTKLDTSFTLADLGKAAGIR
jgi:hypothetical protein